MRFYSSSPSSSPTFEGAAPPGMGGTSFGGSALVAGAAARRALGAGGFRAAVRAPRAGFALPLAFPGAFFALFLARLAVFRFGVRFATLPAAFFAGFFAVFRFVAIEPSYRLASHRRSNDVARHIWPRIVDVNEKSSGR